MTKNSSAKYYQNNKERLQKKSHERYQSCPKEEKEKSNDMIVNDTKSCQKIKSKSLLSIEKVLQNESNCVIIIIRDYYFKK